jgi:hypothetical protein
MGAQLGAYYASATTTSRIHAGFKAECECGPGTKYQKPFLFNQGRLFFATRVGRAYTLTHAVSGYGQRRTLGQAVRLLLRAQANIDAADLPSVKETNPKSLKKQVGRRCQGIFGNLS